MANSDSKELMATSLQRVQDVFQAALAQPAEQRASFLTEACGEDEGLRAEVDSLLEHDQEASAAFLKPPEAGPGIRPPAGPDPLIGATVGRYHVKGVIAAGGMGTIYEAVQEQPHRVVALKIMKRNVASRSALRRFQFESQVLARLRHPNVAQVYEAGTHLPIPSRDRQGADVVDAVPYFAMEYIPGARSITDYAAEKNLITRDRLAMFAKACDAVHHGHQKGIIHRDLKPANILVDSHGEPKVIDFGVARATDSDLTITTQQTNIGQLVGTMQYMSPEQCDADPHDLDTRTDIYSLGVVLFELLTGELPYDATGTTIYQATVAIREQAPRRLSAINPKLRGDVEIITLKALAKDREKRYQSAADLAADIQRHLNREPIEAKPPTIWTRAARWVVRHPVVTTAMTCAAVALGTLVATVLVKQYYVDWYLHARPHEVRLSDDRHAARLLSISGKILHTWTAEPPGLITVAELIDRPAELGGGQLALIGYTQRATNRFAGSLCAFDVEGSREVPVWTRRVETKDILPQLRRGRGYTSEQFGIIPSKIADVFPECPGREIVAAYHHTPGSACVIRIYDLAGQVLYQLWQDGGVNPGYWMSDARLLVFVGLNAEEPWDRRGHSEVRGAHPRVLFAVRPKLNFIAEDWLRVTPGDDPLSPVWYCCLMPPKAIDEIDSWNIGPPLPPRDPGRCVRVYLTVDEDLEAAVFWTVDEFGNEIQGTRVETDGYKRNQKLPDGHKDKLPDPKQFQLGPLPPVVTELRETQ